MSYSETFESFDQVYPKRDPSDPFNLPTLNFVAELDTASMADEASLVPLSPISHSQADESLNGNFPSLATNHSPCSLNDMETDTTGLVRSLSQTSLGAIGRSTSGPSLSFDIPMPNLARGDSQPFRFEQSSAPILEHPPAAPWDSLSSLSSFHPPASSASASTSAAPSTVHPHNSFVMSDSTTYSGKGTSASSTVVVKQEPASYLDAGTPAAKPLANTSGAPLPYLSTPPLNSSLYSKPAATTSSAYSKPLTVFTVSSSVKPEPYSSTNGGNALSSSTPKKRQRRRGPLDKEALAIRRAKHNQVEIRRRQRIAKSFSELKDLTSCDDTNKGVILQAAIEKLKQLESQLASVQSSKAAPAPVIQAPAPAPAPAPSPSPAVSAANAANAAAQEEFYTNMFLNSGVSLLLLSLSGLMIDCNNNFAALVGRTRESLKGQTISAGARNTKSPGQMPTSSVGVQQLLRSEQDVRQFFQAVNQLLRKEVGSSDVIKTVIRQDGSNKDVAVKSMLWLVNEQRASPPYVKCVLTPTDAPIAPAAFSNGRESIKQRVDADSALMRPVTVGAY